MQKHQFDGVEIGYASFRSVNSYGLGWIRENRTDSKTADSISHAGAFGNVAWIDHERELIGVLFKPMPLKDAHPIHKKIRNLVRDLNPVEN